MAEQLWYTWSAHGLERAPGMQARAASDGLRDIRGKRYAALRPHLSYELPSGVIDPTAAPVCLALLDCGQERVLLQKTYIGADRHGRPGNFFVHALVGPARSLSLPSAVASWRAEFWKRSDSDLAAGETQLPLCRIDSLPAGLPASPDPWKLDPPLQADHLRYAVMAILGRKPDQRLFLAATPAIVIALLAALCRVLPTGLLKGLTFSTYERDVMHAAAVIIGTSWGATHTPTGQGAPDLPEACYQQGLALNCWSGRGASLQDLVRFRPYADFAVACLVQGDEQSLRSFLEPVEDAGLSSGEATCSAYAWYSGREAITTENIRMLLADPPLFACLLSHDHLRLAVLESLAAIPAAWAGQVGPALARTRGIASRGSGLLIQKCEALATEAVTLAYAALEFGDLPAAQLLFDQVAANASAPGTDQRRCSDFVNHFTALAEARPSTPMTWPCQFWSLQVATRARLPLTAAILKHWLPASWGTLGLLLAEPTMTAWRIAAVRWMIGLSGSDTTALPPSVPILASQYHDLFGQVLSSLLSGKPDRQQRAMQFVTRLGEVRYTGHTQLVERLISAKVEAPGVIGQLVKSVDPVDIDELLDFVDRNVKILCTRGEIRSTNLGLLRAYLGYMSVARCTSDETRFALNELRLAASTYLDGDLTEQLSSWQSLANFLAHPSAEPDRLRWLADAVTTLRKQPWRADASLVGRPSQDAALVTAVLTALADITPDRQELRLLLDLLAKPLTLHRCDLWRKLMQLMPKPSLAAPPSGLIAYLAVGLTQTQPPCNVDETVITAIHQMDEVTFRAVDRALTDAHADDSLPRTAMQTWRRYAKVGRPQSLGQRISSLLRH